MSLAAETGMGAVRRAAGRVLLAGCIAGGAPAMSAEVFGLVVGIDDYEHLKPLHGAVNDARDVADALEGMAARDVRLLLDGDASREAIFRHWDELTRAAGAGDVLLFHFAGHGGRQDAIIQGGHEAKDNMFLLSGFSDTGEGTAQRIVDNEIGHLLAGETEATVVFVADSCFAGGMVRGVDDRLQGSVRLARTNLGGTDDAVAQRVRALGEVDERDLGHVIWIYGQDDNKTIQEIAVEGQIRGALSHMVSRALRGDADADGDGRLDVRELKRFVSKGVLRLTERRQRPHVNAGSEDISITLATNDTVRPATVEVPVLRIFFSEARPSFALEGVAEVRESRLADVVYSSADRKLVYRTGDVVAEFDSGDSPEKLSSKLQGAVDKWRLIGLLAELDSSDDPQVDLDGGDGVYTEGEQVEFRILSASDRTALLFNLAYDGTVQVLSGSGGTRLRAGRPLNFRARVQEPFGADHLVAITVSDGSEALFDAAFSSHAERHGALLARDLAELLTGVEFGVNWVGLFTQAKEASE